MLDSLLSIITSPVAVYPPLTRARCVCEGPRGGGRGEERTQQIRETSTVAYKDPL